jgi:hypothetical protein
MAITRTPIINDDGSCTTGTIWDNAWKQELYNQIDAADGDSAWHAGPSVSLTDDGGNPVACTVLTTLTRYRPIGATAVIWNCALNPITVTAATTAIYVILGTRPFSLTAPAGTVYPIAWSGPMGVHLNAVNTGALSLTTDNGANFAAGSLWAYWSIVLECAPI